MPSLPAITRSWRYRVNVNASHGSTDTGHRQNLAFEIKDSWIGGGSGWTDSGGSSIAAPTSWVVAASSDSVTANASDNWADASDCVWDTAPSAHSWIVFRHANYFGTSDALEVLLDLSEASSATRNGTMGVYISRDGFDLTSPVVTARPTATDEVEVLVDDGIMTNAAWQGADTNNADHYVGRLHFMMSDDGRAVRLFICRLSTCTAMWDLFRMDDWLTESVSVPAMMMVASRDSDTELLTWSNFQVTTYCQYVSRDSTIGVSQYRAQLYQPVYSGSNTAASAGAACNLGGISSSGLLAVDMEVLTPATGYAGTLVDLWWGRAVNAGLHYPADGSRTFAQLGVLAFPWNGSQIVIA